jgi:hypothetical protein
LDIVHPLESDMHMPMAGIETEQVSSYFFAELKAAKITAAVPILIFTVHIMESA